MIDALDGVELSPLAIASIEDALQVFAKALRATQMYLPNNPTRAHAIERARAAFGTVLTQVQPFELQIHDASFRWEERVVYQDVDRGTEGLPWLLYRDGLRSLTFHRGFEEHELELVLDVLRRARSTASDDDDLVTMLWVADLQALEFTHVEIGGLSDLPTTTGERLGIISRTSEQLPLAVPGTETPSPGDGAPPGIVRMDDFDSTLYFLEPREVTYLAEELKREYVEDQRNNALGVLFDIVESAPVLDAQCEAARLVDQLLLEFLAVGDYQHVGMLLRESGVIVRKALVDPSVLALLAELPARLSDPTVMSQLLQALDEGARTPVASLLEGVFSELRPSALVPLVAWLGTATASPVRAAIERASLRLAGANATELARLLEHTDMAVVRGALRLSAQLATPAAVPGLAKLLRGDDAKMRIDAVAALGDIGSVGALQALERGIDDAEREVRVATFRALTVRKHAGALPKLAQSLRRKELRVADLGEKMALFEAYGTLCGDAGVAELDQLLNARGLLGAREPAELRACAARALGLISTASASAALQRASDTKDVVVRSAVMRAMRSAT